MNEAESNPVQRQMTLEADKLGEDEEFLVSNVFSSKSNSVELTGGFGLAREFSKSFCKFTIALSTGACVLYCASHNTKWDR